MIYDHTHARTHVRTRARVYIIYDIVISFTENCFLENYYLVTVHLSINSINAKNQYFIPTPIKMSSSKISSSYNKRTS